MSFPNNSVTGPNAGQLLTNTTYINTTDPLWLSVYNVPILVNPQVSTLTVNPVPTGNILLQSAIDPDTSQRVNAPLIFQRPPADINAPSESLVMNTSLTVPTYPIDGEFITATKDAGTAYDDIAVKGLQIFGGTTTAGNAGAVGYITSGPLPGSMKIYSDNVFMDRASISTLDVVNLISSTTSAGSNFTALDWISTPVLYVSSIQAPVGPDASKATINIANISCTSLYASDHISTQAIYTSTLKATEISTIYLDVSTISGFNLDTDSISSILGNIQFSLVSTLQFKAEIGSPNINLGLGNVIQGLIGGAATQGLGAILGATGLITGATAMILGRQSGGVNSNVFQTVNGSTQLQFSTIGTDTLNYLAVTDSADPLHVPGNLTYISTPVAAGTYCVRSLSDPLNVTENTSSIQMFGQWVPVLTNGLNLSTLNVSTLSSINVEATGHIDAGLITTGGLTSLGSISGQSITATQQLGSLSSIISPAASISTLSVSSINGQVPGTGGTVPPDLNLSTLTMNGYISSVNSTDTINWLGSINGSNVTANAQLASLSSITSPNASVSSLTVSSINGQTPGGGGGTVPPNLTLSTLTMNGAISCVTPAATLTWPGQANLGNILTNSLSCSGSISASGPIGCASVQVNGQGAVNAWTMQAYSNITSPFATIGNINSPNSAVLGPTTTGNLTVLGTLEATQTAVFRSTLTASTINIVNNASLLTSLGSISSLSVSSINGGAPQGGYSIPSTLATSTITNNNFVSNGNITNLNTSSLLTWAGPTSFSTVTCKSVTANLINTVAESVSTLSVSTINGLPPAVDYQIPSTLSINNMTVTGSFFEGNPNTTFTWDGPAVFVSTSMNSITFKDYFESPVGTITASDEPQQGITAVTPYGMSIRPSTISPFPTATFSNNYCVQFFSTVTAATVLNQIGSISSLNVSSINGLAPSAGFTIPSTLSVSSINMSGILNLTNVVGVVESANVVADTFAARSLGTPSLFEAGFIDGGDFQNGTQALNLRSDIAINFTSITGGPNPIASFRPTNGAGNQPLITLQNQVEITNVLNVHSTINCGNGISTIVVNASTITATNLIARTVSSINNNASQAFFDDVTIDHSLTVTGAATLASISTVNVKATSAILTPLLQATNSITTPSMSVNSITSLTSVNGTPYPPPQVLPIGAIVPWAGGSYNTPYPPTGWLICDGTKITQPDYPALFSVIGQTYYNPGYLYSDNYYFLPDLTFTVPMGAPTAIYIQRQQVGVTCTSVASFAGFPTPVYANQIWKITSVFNMPIVINTEFKVYVDAVLYDLYVSDILSGGGLDGYYLMQLISPASNPPVFPVITTQFIPPVGYYTFPISGSSVQSYSVGTYNDDGLKGRRISHNQTTNEVGPHYHSGVPNVTSSAIVGTGYSVGNGGTTSYNVGSYVNPNLPAGQTQTNFGTKTAPNFINMLYIIYAGSP